MSTPIRSDQHDKQISPDRTGRAEFITSKSINMAKKGSEIMIPDETVMDKIYLI